MKKEIKNKWTAALRSGEYEQTTGYLCDVKNGWCCLGVLMDVVEEESFVDSPEYEGFKAIKSTKIDLWERTEEDYYDVNELSNEVIKKYGLDGYDDELMEMNDNLGKTFPEIADWIEENIPSE